MLARPSGEATRFCCLPAGTAGPECARCTGGQEGCADGGWRAGPSEGVTAGYARQEAGDGGRLAMGDGICDGHSVCKGMR